MRNYKLDVIKGLATILILVIHIGTFTEHAETEFYMYTRSLLSLCVPVFFLISGYFYYYSKNKMLRLKSLLILYLKYSVVLFFFDYLVLGIGVEQLLKDVFTLGGSSIGYLWFVKVLIYYMLTIAILEKILKNETICNVLTVVFMVYAFQMILVIFGRDLLLTGNTHVGFCYINAGYLVAHYKINRRLKIPNLMLLVIPIIFIFLDYGYNRMLPRTFFAAMIILINGLDSKINSNPLKFITRNSLNYLFVHYFIIQIFIIREIFYDNKFIINLIILFVVTTSVVLVMDIVKSYLIKNRH